MHEYMPKHCPNCARFKLLSESTLNHREFVSIYVKQIYKQSMRLHLWTYKDHLLFGKLTNVRWLLFVRSWTKEMKNFSVYTRRVSVKRIFKCVQYCVFMITCFQLHSPQLQIINRFTDK